jgi:hypothetical protein
VDAAGLHTRYATLELDTGERASLPLHLLDIIG